MTGQNVHANQGESVRLICQASGDPQPSIWWSKVQVQER